MNILLSDCGSCHSPQAAPADSGGIRFIGDLEQLVAAGLIVPLSSAQSRVIQVMEEGSMPPPASRLPPIAQPDIDTVAAYIDNPRYWPAAADAGADGG